MADVVESQNIILEKNEGIAKITLNRPEVLNAIDGEMIIEEAVEEKLEEILGDPDLGLELREKIKERLRRFLTAMEAGEEGIPLEQVISQAGLS